MVPDQLQMERRSVDDHEAVAALVAEARKWIAKRSSPPRMELRTLH
jgi:hypothetical protein